MGDYNAGSVELGLRVNTKEYDRQINGIRKIAAKTAKVMAGAFTVKAITSFGKQCLELGSDLQEVQNVVDTVFPNMEDKVNKFAQNAAASYGLSETMAKRYAGTFGAMADAFGFAEKESYNMATALTGLAGDVASFYNITQDEAYTKLKSVFTGETESLKDLGVVMTQAALDAYALSNGYGKVTSSMTEAEKVALRFAFVQDQLSNASGDFAKTSGSWANQVRLLSLQFQSLQAAIGQGLINVLTPVIQWLNTLMSKLVGAANAFKRFTETLTGKKSQPITLKETSDSVNSVTTGADNASTALNKTTKKAKALKRELAGFDQINKLSDNSSSDSDSGSPSGSSTGTTIAETPTTETPASVEKLTEKYKNLGKAVDKLKGSFKAFTDVLSSAGKWAYDNVLVPLGQWTMNKLLPRIIELLAAAFDVLTAVLKALAPIFQTVWSTFLKPIAKFTGKLILGFLDAFTKSLNKLAGAINEHPKLFQTFVTALLGLLAVKKVTSKFTDGIGAIKAFRKGIVTATTVASAFSPKLGNLSKLAKSFGNTLKYTKSPFRAFSALFPKLAKRAGVVSKALKFLLPKGPIVLGIMAAVAAGVLIYKNWDKIKKAATKLKKNVVKAFDSIVDKIKEIPKKIKQWFKGKIEGVEEWFGSIADAFVNMLSKLTENVPDLSEVATAISDSIGEIKAKISAWFADKKEDLAQKWNSLTENVKEKTAELKAAISQKWSDIKKKWTDITDNISEKTAEMKATIGSKWEDLKAGWEGITSNIADKTATMYADAKEKVAGAIASLKEKWISIEDRFPELKATAKNVNNKVLDTLKNAWNVIKNKSPVLKALATNKNSGVLKTLKNAWSAIKNKTAKVTGKAVNKNSDTLKTLKDSWAAIKSKTVTLKAKVKATVTNIKEWINTNVIGKLNEKLVSTGLWKKGPIPLLAEGGFVKKNTPQLAMIGDNRHQGEVVAPENKLLEMAKMAAAGSGGRDAEIVALLKEILLFLKSLNLEATVEGDSLMRLVVKLINQRTKSTGQCPIKI